MRLAITATISAALLGAAAVTGASAATCGGPDVTINDKPNDKPVLRSITSIPGSCFGFGTDALPFQDVGEDNLAELTRFQRDRDDPSIQFLGWAKRIPGTSKSGFEDESVPPGDLAAAPPGIELFFADSGQGPFGTWGFTVNDPLLVLSNVFLGIRLGVADDGLTWGTFSLADGESSGQWFVDAVFQDDGNGNGAQEGVSARAVAPQLPTPEEMYLWGSATVIPLPPAFLLLASAMGGLVLIRRRKAAA